MMQSYVRGYSSLGLERNRCQLVTLALEYVFRELLAYQGTTEVRGQVAV